MRKVYHHQIEGIPVQTGDILCTVDGKPDIVPVEFWRLVSRLIPGYVHHVAIYIGPDGRCIEAGTRGVIKFTVFEGRWNAERMGRRRGLLLDTFQGVVSPLEALPVPREQECEMRLRVAEYCLAQVGKPYNLNFLNAETEDAFYCSQLAYKAYQQVGVNLNTGLALENLPSTDAIIYPQEIWDGFPHRAARRVEPYPVSPRRLATEASTRQISSV